MKVTLKDEVRDNICRSIFILKVLTYIGWFVSICILYPLQINPDDGTYNVPVIAGIILSFITLCIVLFYLNRIYEHRIFQLKVEKSRKKYRAEMRELQNWELQGEEQ